MTNEEKQLERAEYRAQLAEAELGSIKSSKAYRLIRGLGAAKARIQKDPVGVAKKAAKILLTDPKRAKRIITKVVSKQGQATRQSLIDNATRYQEWILLNEPDEAELDAQRTASATFAKKPLISIITPVFNPPAGALEELIESVLEQTYPYFELCLGDFGDHEDVRAVIEKYAAQDKRVKAYIFKENGMISRNSNQLLKRAKGEYCALLDHDDTLSPDALYENVKLLNEHPYDFIYSDKDKIDEQGNRFDPLFKPQFSPELMLNANYLTHFNVMKTSLVREVGAWDPDTDGAQDWDLFLKIMLRTKEIGHVPKVLYHWRVIATSTALSIETKPYALAGQRTSVDKYLAALKVKGEAYTRTTELLIKWDRAALDQRPLVYIMSSNVTSTMRTMRTVTRLVPKAEFAVLMPKDAAGDDTTRGLEHVTVLQYDDHSFASVLQQHVKGGGKTKKDRTVLFVDDRLRLPARQAWYDDLTGWLQLPGLAVVSGRIVDRRDIIIDSGAVVTRDYKAAPIFKGCPKYYQTYIGNAEWVRDLRIVSPLLWATKLSELQRVGLRAAPNPASVMADYFVAVSEKQRLALIPHVTASSFDDITSTITLDEAIVKRALGKVAFDTFGNPNLNPENPMHLFEDETLPATREALRRASEPIDRYQHDALILAQTFDISQQELAANQKVVSDMQPITPRTVGWFLPAFDGIYAGLLNIFSFANYLSSEHQLKTHIFILKADDDVSSERLQVLDKFPGLKQAQFTAIRPNQLEHLPKLDIGIATQWATAFPLARYQQVARKCYFIQDNEANFYPKGSVSSLVELTYRFGFTAIANTNGLLDNYRIKYGGTGVVVKSVVDLSVYQPPKEHYKTPQKPYKVFLYARPNMPRNAFELGVAGLKLLKEHMGDDVELITAGAEWDPEEYGVAGLFTNLGKVDYAALPKFYRSLDAGVMFMFSGHPGVIASELMASGCPVVVNEYDDATWHELYKDGETCLVTLPTASEIARNVQRCLEDEALRKTLIDGGLKKVAHFYDGYRPSLDVGYQAIVSGKLPKRMPLGKAK